MNILPELNFVFNFMRLIFGGFFPTYVLPMIELWLCHRVTLATLVVRAVMESDHDHRAQRTCLWPPIGAWTS